MRTPQQLRANLASLEIGVLSGLTGGVETGTQRAPPDDQLGYLWVVDRGVGGPVREQRFDQVGPFLLRRLDGFRA